MIQWTSAYKRHGRSVLAFLMRRVESREVAEDICQETFMRAMKAQDRLRDPDKLRPYLFRIANNLMINHARRHKRVRTESELGDTPTLELVAGPASYCPERRQNWRELCDALSRELTELPSEQRQAFELGVLQRRPYTSIAEETGWSVAKVKINVYRARKRLIAGLSEYQPAVVSRALANGGEV
ncbi:MAG: RNA polymerase sigma factor [bacterium]|nr:RNA polymerase sigma factor [bacterium]